MMPFEEVYKHMVRYGLSYNEACYMAKCLLEGRDTVQGSANPQTPGSENKRIKSCVLLPAAGRRTQLFHLIFSEPGVCGFADPCMLNKAGNLRPSRLEHFV